jgi:AraC family transcriptional regulator
MSDTGCIINVPEPGKTEVLFYLSPFSFMLCRKIIDCRYAGETGRLMQLAGATDLLTDNFKSCYNQSAGREESIVLEVINYIRNNLSEEHSLAKLAHMAGMSHTKLNRLFRIKMGLSVFEFIRQEKVHRAEHYLRTTDMTITEIAYCTGFCSSSHFSESFRREKGLSPKLYRKSV